MKRFLFQFCLSFVANDYLFFMKNSKNCTIDTFLFLLMSTEPFELSHCISYKLTIFVSILKSQKVYGNITGTFLLQDEYCFDVVLDYCKGNLTNQQNIRAVIRDKTLHASRQATVYGSSSDNSTVRIFKQIGYIVSIFFLLLTLAIYLVIKEVRAVSKIQYITRIYLLTLSIKTI